MCACSHTCRLLQSLFLSPCPCPAEPDSSLEGFVQEALSDSGFPDSILNPVLTPSTGTPSLRPCPQATHIAVPALFRCTACLLVWCSPAPATACTIPHIPSVANEIAPWLCLSGPGLGAEGPAVPPAQYCEGRAGYARIFRASVENWEEECLHLIRVRRFCPVLPCFVCHGVDGRP